MIEPDPICTKYYYDDETLRTEEYTLYGRLHNPYGPAIILYDRDGKRTNEMWYKNGEFIKITNYFTLKNNNFSNPNCVYEK